MWHKKGNGATPHGVIPYLHRDYFLMGLPQRTAPVFMSAPIHKQECMISSAKTYRFTGLFLPVPCAALFYPALTDAAEIHRNVTAIILSLF